MDKSVWRAKRAPPNRQGHVVFSRAGRSRSPGASGVPSITCPLSIGDSGWSVSRRERMSIFDFSAASLRHVSGGGASEAGATRASPARRERVRRDVSEAGATRASPARRERVRRDASGDGAARARPKWRERGGRDASGDGAARASPARCERGRRDASGDGAARARPTRRERGGRGASEAEMARERRARRERGGRGGNGPDSPTSPAAGRWGRG